MSTRKHYTVVAVAFVAGFLVAPRTASAYYSLLGGETLKVRDNAISVQVGYPEIRLGYHIPILKNLEVNPKLNLFYGGFGNQTTGDLTPGNFGLRVGADVRLNVFSQNDVHIALMWKLGFHFNFVGASASGDDFAAGMQLGFPGGVVVGWDVLDSLTIVGGLHVPFFVTFTDPVAFVVPIIWEAGVEYGLTDTLNITAMLEAGPSILSVNDATAVSAYVAALVGIGYLF